MAAPPLPSASSASAPALPSWTSYSWLQEPTTRADSPAPTETLEQRFPAPAPLRRAEVSPDSWEAWLRGLPLAAPETPVRSYRGDVLLTANHPNIAAVIAIDPGSQDLQQCADSILRLEGEWRWARGDRVINYQAASGTSMPFARWQQGERPFPVNGGRTLAWKRQTAASAPTYGMFRSYLDAVFTYANTGSLFTQSRAVAPHELRAGDFFVEPGAPGHAVLVLDLVQGSDGRKHVLLAQGFMPAQNLHVLRPDGSSSPWFALDETNPSVKTPFWKPFPWRSLRRLPRR